MLTLLTGGIRSGKSRYALDLAGQSGRPGPNYFLATAEPLDEEMKLRITRHQEERSGHFVTVEEPLFLGKAIQKAGGEAGIILVDCLTVWVGNLMHHFESQPPRVRDEIEAFLGAVSLRGADMIFVTNEVGLGLIPQNPLARRYTDELGKLNQELAKICDEVIFMVSGIPARIKNPVKNHA